MNKSYLSDKFFQFFLASAVLYLFSIHLAILFLAASSVNLCALFFHWYNFFLKRFLLYSSALKIYFSNNLRNFSYNFIHNSYLLCILSKKSNILAIGTALTVFSVIDASAKAFILLSNDLLLNCSNALSNNKSLSLNFIALSFHLWVKYLNVINLFLSSQFSNIALKNLSNFKNFTPFLNWSSPVISNLFLNLSVKVLNNT